MKSVIMGHFFCSTLNFIKSSDLSFIYRQKSHIPQRGDLQPTEPPCVFSKLNKPAMMWIITPRLAEAFFFFNRLLSHCSSSQCCIVLLTLTPSALYFSPDGGGSCFQSDGSGIKECWTSICQLASYTEFRQILIEADQGGGSWGGGLLSRGVVTALQIYWSKDAEDQCHTDCSHLLFFYEVFVKWNENTEHAVLLQPILQVQQVIGHSNLKLQSLVQTLCSAHVQPNFSFSNSAS